MNKILITGANRGIGIALVKQLLNSNESIVATYRSEASSKALIDLSVQHPEKLQLLQLDVVDDKSISRFGAQLAKNTNHIDILINNAGALEEYGAPLSELSFEKLEKMFRINTFGPMKIIKEALPLLKKSDFAKVINITSKVGSITDNTSGNAYGYRMSKTALNMFNKSFSIEQPDICSVLLHPGWVQTEMGGDNAPTTVSESAQGMIKVIGGLKIEDTAKFLDFQGTPIPW